MEETGTIEFVRNAVIASVCGHSRGIGGKPCFRLLSGRPWVRIPPGVQKIRQEQQNVENLTDFSFQHSNYVFRQLANF